MSDFDPVDTDRQDAAQQDKVLLAKVDERTFAEDIKWLMSSPRGRRIVWRILGITGIYRSSFTGNSETFFREGGRSIGLQVLGWVNAHAVDRYVAMLQEHRTK